MNESKINESATDEEIIGVLTAISVVSKRLARNLIQLEQQKKSMEGATIMSKINEVEQTIRDLRDAASLLNDTANWLYELFSADKVQEHNTDSAETQKQLTLEEVRAVCAEKSRAGFTAEVKSIITKHGADKLSAIKPEEYAAVLAEVEVLGNAD